MRVQSTRNASPYWRKEDKSFRVGHRRSNFIFRCYWRCSCRRTCSILGQRIFIPRMSQQKLLLFRWSRWQFGRFFIGWPQSLRLAFAWQSRERHVGQRVAFALRGHSKEVFAVRYDPRNDVLASAGFEKVIKLYTPITQQWWIGYYFDSIGFDWCNRIHFVEHQQAVQLFGKFGNLFSCTNSE